jgi:hypothetical protein
LVEPVDSLASFVAQESGLPRIAHNDLPMIGTYWSVYHSKPFLIAPLPVPPLDVNLPVYWLGGGQFLVDETGGGAPAASEIPEFVLALASQIGGLRAQISSKETGWMEFSAASSPGSGGEAGEGILNPPTSFAQSQGLCLWPPIITSSNTVLLVITNTVPNWETNAYDLFYTTNLAKLPAPELCLTNWVWADRSQPPEQTKFEAAIADRPQGWFRLGTLQDSDGDGLTDAFETLVAHTDPADQYSAADSNGNRVPDWLETAMGFDPNQTNSLGKSQTGFQLFLAQPVCKSHLP